MFFLELTTGLRKGELVPLLWSDVDTENMTISISKQAYRSKGALTVQPPKTDNSIRRIALSEETMELLKQEHDKHSDNPYLFPSTVTGGMYHPDSVVKLHQKILKGAELEHIRFHDLRRTFATLTLQNGIDVKHAGPQQRRIHPRHLHPRHEQGTGTGCGKDGKPAETGTLIQ